MDPSEVEFLAEKETITIVPSFSQNKIFLISGDVGPFVPSIPVRVPLWMALNLRQRQMCRIVPPDWMDVDQLEAKKQEESEAKLFTKMPCEFYREIPRMLLDVGAVDIPRADEIHALVKDIWDMRMAKLRSSIDAFVKSEEVHAKLNHLTLMELNLIRPLLTGSLDLLYRLRKNREARS